MKRSTQRKLIFAALLLVILLQISIAYLIISKEGEKEIKQEYAKSNIGEVSKKTIPAVVYIQADGKSGSGTIVSSDGYILTNNHVISESKEINARLENKKIYRAELVGFDAQTDVALLKINATNLPIIGFGDSDAVEVGDTVVAIGNPYGYDFTVTAGIISAKHRDRGPTEYRDFLQTDASINPGNSGGPLIDMNGDFIGITTFIVSDSRAGELGFAIPINLARAIMDRLVKYGKVERSYMGVSLQDKVSMDNSTGEGKIIDGSEIVSFDPKAPAIKSGLQIGDIIIKVNNQTMSNANQLRNYIAWIPVGSNITVHVLRNETEMAFNVTTVLRPKF